MSGYDSGGRRWLMAEIGDDKGGGGGGVCEVSIFYETEFWCWRGVGAGLETIISHSVVVVSRDSAEKKCNQTIIGAYICADYNWKYWVKSGGH